VDEATRMVGMGVRQENGGRGDMRKEVQPVGTTIDHNLGFPAGDDDAAVASVKSRARSNPPRVPRKVIATNSREPRCALSAICRGRTIRLLQRKLVQDPAGACCV
jgi:hypothetical protein